MYRIGQPELDRIAAVFAAGNDAQDAASNAGGT